MRQQSAATQATGSVAPASLSEMGGHILQRKCACGKNTAGGGACGKCANREMRVQRRAAREGEYFDASAAGSVNDALRSIGRPLDSVTRSFMESRFGHDFSGVRIHTDALAQKSARDVNALAYTLGRDIAFGAGQYAPASVEGRRLIAHELAHVVQQSSLNGAGHSLSAMRDGAAADDSASEREADAAADSVLSGAPVPVLRSTPVGMLSRKAGGQKTATERRGTACPQTFVIPDYIYNAIDLSWRFSGHGTDTPQEHGGRIVKTKYGRDMVRLDTGTGTETHIDPKTYPVEPGDVNVGEYHTHPYKKHLPLLGVTFSAGDLRTFMEGENGSVSYLGAGSCYFVLNTVNQAQRAACNKLDIAQRHEDGSDVPGNTQQREEAGVKAAIRGCGICYYKACRPDAASPVPKTATLVQDERAQ